MLDNSEALSLFESRSPVSFKGKHYRFSKMRCCRGPAASRSYMAEKERFRGRGFCEGSTTAATAENRVHVPWTT